MIIQPRSKCPNSAKYVQPPPSPLPLSLQPPFQPPLIAASGREAPIRGPSAGTDIKGQNKGPTISTARNYSSIPSILNSLTAQLNSQLNSPIPLSLLQSTICTSI